MRSLVCRFICDNSKSNKNDSSNLWGYNQTKVRSDQNFGKVPDDIPDTKVPNCQSYLCQCIFNNFMFILLQR